MSGALVRLQDPPRFAYPARAAAPREVRTDAAGRARLDGLDPKLRYDLEVEPPPAQDDLRACAIPRWAPEDTVVTLERPRAIRGVVHDQQGRPVPRARLIWAHVPESVEERVTALTAEVGADGRFALTNLLRGSYRLWVRPPLEEPLPPKLAAPREARVPEIEKPTIVPSGREDVVLVLHVPSRLQFRVRGWAKQARTVEARLVPEAQPRKTPALAAKLDKDGLVAFDDLPRDTTYALWVHVPKENAYVYATGLVVDDRRREVTLETGEIVTGRIVAPPGTSTRKVWAAYPGFDVQGRLKAAGRFEIRGLPPGPWTIRASGRKGETTLRAEAETEFAEDVVLTLQP